MVILEYHAAALALTAVIVVVSAHSFYRLFLGPLAQVPGPKLAALTRWYECFYDLFRPAQYVFKIAELHKRYGRLMPPLHTCGFN
jgi:hypothetical protein